MTMGTLGFGNYLGVDTSFWDSVDFTSTGIFGTFHIDTPYNPDLGGYGWGVSLSVWTQAKGGTATADFGHTTSLQSVTLLDGSPVDVTFDSGLQLTDATVVPEPSTLVAAAIGTIALLGRYWLRRKRGDD